MLFLGVLVPRFLLFTTKEEGFHCTHPRWREEADEAAAKVVIPSRSTPSK
jgi:hypothetical protein